MTILAVGIAAVYFSAAKTLGYFPFPYGVQSVNSDQGLPLKDFYVQNGRVTGIAREYFADGQLSAEYAPDGSVRKRATRTLMRDRTYEVTRELTGAGRKTIRTYAADGTKEIEHVYQDGKFLDERYKPFNGVYKYYYPGGQVREEITYQDGKSLGPRRGYYPSGQLRFEYEVTKENPYSSGKAYYPNGVLQSVIETINGEQVIKRYDREGDLLPGV